MKFFFFLFFSFVLSNVFAQREAYSWIYGNCDPDLNNCQGVFGTAIIKFNDDSIESIRRVDFPGSFRFHALSISNSDGELLMASNSSYVYDSLGNVLIDFFSNDTLQLINSPRHSALFLKLNDETNNYYFLNLKGTQWIGTPPNTLLNNRTVLHYLSKIRVDENGYNIVQMDTLWRNDTIVAGGMQACRHANGRDWWIFQSTFNQKQYLRGLLTPYGLNFEVYDGPGPDAFQNSGQNQFSSDGTKLFHYITTSVRKMQIYDFDRCTGELSNFREIDFSGFIPFPPYDFTPYVLSPDASKIFMGRSNPGVGFSYQNIQVDVETGQMNVIADSVYVPCFTPNLKWVVSGYQEEPFTLINKLNVFTQPNELGQECGRIKDLYSLFIDGFRTEPIEYANHLLGPIDGSSCDTLGLDDDTGIKKVDRFNVNMFPNPGKDEINFITDLPLPIKLIIRDSQGKKVIENRYNQKAFTILSCLSELNPGIYFVELQNEGKALRLVMKWMKIG
jgi:hypothetical protein